MICFLANDFTVEHYVLTEVTFSSYGKDISLWGCILCVFLIN